MPTTITANTFHEGSTCPFCQESISSGQSIIICPDCGAVQHDLCWNHNDGCSSYHCDKKVSSSQPGFQPELTITEHDLAKVRVPEKPKHQTPEEVAKAYTPTTSAKLSILSVISLIFAFLGLIGIIGLVIQQVAFFVISLMIALLAVLLGVIALVRINLNPKISGGIIAVITISLSCLIIAGDFIVLHFVTRKETLEQRVNLQMSSMPSEEHLKSLPPSKSSAIKANVVIKCSSSGFFKNLSFGSGVITKIKDKKAFILTNKHVIGVSNEEEHPEKKIMVMLYNGESCTGEIEWLAPGNIDIAIISCEVLTLKDFSPVRVARKTMAPSQQVFAIGNPMNFSWSYTEGVISSIRSKKSSSRDIEVYQTQTPINQGNSGGGLYSMEGILIGINTWTLNKSFAEGLNFSISTKSIVDLLNDRAKEFLLFGRGER